VAADTQTATNTAAIAVPAAGSANATGPGSPYPSPITISGLTEPVSDVNVSLNSFSHTIASDVDVLLVGPAGQNLVLMSDVKGDSGFPINNATLTFDDAAAGLIPATGALTTGTFKPTNRDDASGTDTFPAPAPAPSSATTLSVFNGSNPNGQWRLFTVDDTSGDVGSIAGGWSLSITTAPVSQPGEIEFTTGAFRGAEGQGPVTLTLHRIGGSDGAVSVTIATTTPATAVPGLDFTPLSQTVSFASGQTTAAVPVTIRDDSAVEGVDETFTVALSAPTGGATLGTRSTAVVSIDDNDATFDTTPVTIPASGTGASSGAPAAPYPDNIDVRGQASLIAGVDVTLTGFSHQVPIDVDILLVGPQGQNVVLMSDVGGNTSASGVNLTFSDSAANTIPVGGPLTTGTFRPSDDDTDGADSFPAPAPAPSTATDLSTFRDINPNGRWSLYIVDDASGDTGSISGGWSLLFLPAVVPSAGGPYTVAEGSPLTLDASATVAPAGAAFAWDLDNDGQFDDATGRTPTISAATLATLGLGDGPAGPVTIGLQVRSSPTVRTATSTVTVTNVAPTASVPNVPSGLVAGTPASVTFGATDPAAADNAAGFTYRIDWGDGTPVQTVTGGASVTASHTWATSGTFTISVTASDKDGGTSAVATASADVGAPVVADAGGPYSIAEGSDLVLDGTGTSAGPTATYEWDLDNDGQFDDATGANPTISAATLATLGLDDGPAGPLTVSLRAPTVHRSTPTAPPSP
jgi:subtilisin-like proprotein convertase family protein